MTAGPSFSLPSLTDLQDVRRKLAQLVAEGRTEELLDLVLALLLQLRDTNTALSVRLHNALRALYGRKSEKLSTEQLSLLFAELGGGPTTAATTPAEPLPAPAEPPAQKDSEQVAPPETPPPPPRGRGGRTPLPAHLPRTTRVVAVPLEERICAQCGAAKVCIGHRSSEVLEFIPAHFQVIEEKREKLACPACPEQGVTTAPSEKVMDRGRPGPGLLAHLLVGKFPDALPIYRQAQGYERCGVSLSTSTLGEWTAFGLDVLAPVAERIFERVLDDFVVQADDTGLRVLDRDHPMGVKRGHLWAFVGSGLVAFRYAPDWKATRPAQMLRSFQGYLQGDGYAGYEAMLRDGKRGEPLVPPERRLGCGMHLRSKFEKAAKAGDARAVLALAYFKTLYRIEAVCKEQRLCAEERTRRRQELSIPVVDALYAWVHELLPRVVPKTPLEVAARYAVNQEALWRRCFSDGRFEIDNGEVERQIRRVALGRKNYLFAGSDKGAERLAIGYSVFGSCHRAGVDPLAWATDVIRSLQAGWPRARLDELLPAAWRDASLATGGESDRDTS